VGVFKPLFDLPKLSFNYAVIIHKENFSSFKKEHSKTEIVKLLLSVSRKDDALIDKILHALRSLKLSRFSAAEIIELKSVVTNSVSMIILLFVGSLILLSSFMLGSMKLLEVEQKEGEIGLKVAVGATNVNIIREIVTETFLMTTIAGGAGILIGAVITMFAVQPVVNGLGLIKTGVVEVEFTSIIIAFCVLVLMSTFASYLPCKKALSIEPSQTMRSL
jgi:ABC-type antimicrobial peptide transport system permease subunit